MTPEHLPVEITRRHVNGVTLEVAAAGPVSGPLVVLLHGFPDLWQGWHFQIAPLVEAGFRVLAPNQRGYGASDKPHGVRAYDLDILADDVLALVEAEERSTFCLIGHDWGGLVAWWTAARFPQQIERLAVLSAPHPGVFKSYLLRSLTQVLRSSYIGLFQIPWLPEALLSANNYRPLFWAVQATGRAGTFDESDYRYLVSGWSRPGSVTAMLNYYRALARRSERSLKLEVQVPTLLLYGRRDPAEEPGLLKASETLCHNWRTIEFPEARHWIQREEPERVNRELLSFLLPVPEAKMQVENAAHHEGFFSPGGL